MSEEMERVASYLDELGAPKHYDLGDGNLHPMTLVERIATVTCPRQDDMRSTMERLADVLRDSSYKPTQRYLGAAFLGYDYARRLCSGQIAHPVSSPPQNDAGVEDDSEEAYQLGKREGYEEALADVDRRTGGDGEYFASTIPGRGCPDGHAMMAKIVGRFETRTPMSELQALGQEFEAGWRPIETMKLWEVGVVSDGELACVSQKAQGDFDEGDEHYFAIDPEDALEWQPTHWLPLPSAPSGEV